MDDPTLSKIQKFAAVLFECLYLFPVVFLVADGLYNLRFVAEGIYQSCYPNLKTLPAPDPVPHLDPAPVIIIDPPPAPPNTPIVNQPEPPLIIEQPVPPVEEELLPAPLPNPLPFLLPAPQIGLPPEPAPPQVEELLPAPHGEDVLEPAPVNSPNPVGRISHTAELALYGKDLVTSRNALAYQNSLTQLADVLRLPSYQNRSFPMMNGITGNQLALVLPQIQAAMPDFLALRPDARADHQIPVQIGNMQGQLTGREIGRDVANLFCHMEEEFGLVFRPEQAPLRLTEEEVGDDFIFIPSAAGKEIAAYEQTTMGALWANLHRCILDPGNPEKGKKYTYSLYATRELLNQKFPRWRRELLPMLAERAAANKESFEFYAACALSALNQLESDQDVRIRYAFITEHLRSALQKMPLENGDPVLEQTRQILLELCHSKFTGVYLYPFLEDFISKALNARQSAQDAYQLPNHLSSESIAHAIHGANQRLGTAPPIYMQRLVAKEYKKLQGTLGWGFDPTGDSNTPWVHSIQTTAGGKEITVLRHGTPTRDPSFFGLALRQGLNLLRRIPLLGGYVWDDTPTSVIPEYEAHLNAHPEKQTLYTNHQQYDESGDHAINGEIARSAAIRGLELSHRNFHFLALPLDGPLWKKANLERTDAAKLKNDLLRSLMRRENGFGIPRALEANPHLQAELRAILDQVHDLYFNGGELPSVEKKKVFMMLFYSELKDYIKVKLNIDFIASVCKDNKDRGNASALVDMVKNLYKLGLEDDPERLRELFFTALGPFIIKNESIIDERLELALNVMDHLAEFDDAQREKIRNAVYASGFQIAEQRIPKEERGPSQMMSPQNFLETIDYLRDTKERRVFSDPNFETDILEAYKNGGEWNLAKIEHQVRRDLPHIDLRVNGEKIVSYERLDEIFGGDAASLALLHQGAAAGTMSDPAKQLNGNALNLVVAQPVISASRKAVIDLIYLYNTEGEEAALAAMPLEKTETFKEYLANAVETGLLPASFGGDKGIKGKPVYPTRISVVLEDDIREIHIEQELDLTNRMEEGDRGFQLRSYPILAKALVNDEPAARISWQFVGA